MVSLHRFCVVFIVPAAYLLVYGKRGGKNAKDTKEPALEPAQ